MTSKRQANAKSFDVEGKGALLPHFSLEVKGWKFMCIPLAEGKKGGSKKRLERDGSVEEVCKHEDLSSTSNIRVKPGLFGTCGGLQH